MDPVSVWAPVVKAILSQVGKEVGTVAVKGAKTQVLGDPQQKALERALVRAFEKIKAQHGAQLGDFDINQGFLQHEAAQELSKLLVPGETASPARLAERAVDSLGPAASPDQRLNRIIKLRHVFADFLEVLATEARREPALQTLLGQSDAAHAARSSTRLAESMQANAASEDDRIRYLTWVIDQHRYLRTAGVVRNMTVQLPLNEVFVGLRALHDLRPGDRAWVRFQEEREQLVESFEAEEIDQITLEGELDRLQARYGRSSDTESDGSAADSVLVVDAIRDATHALVLGDPGTGKTTLLRYLALSHAMALLADEPVEGRSARLPIYIRTGDYARYGFPRLSLSDFIPIHLNRSECRTPGLADLIGRLLESGRCIVLLDGLDEIASLELRRDVVGAVMNFVAAYGRQGNRFVVTSRIAGYPSAPMPEQFRALRLQDMDDPTIAKFLQVYCRKIEEAEAPGKSMAAIMAAGDQEATAIDQALSMHPGVRRLAASPLLLTALVLVHRASRRLPHRRVEAYVEVCNALGRTWRSAQGVAESDLPDERILHRWLIEVAAWMHEHRPEGTATKRELLQVLGPLWATHQGLPWNPHILDAADPLGTDAGRGVLEFIEKVDTHTGLFVERAPGLFGFAHLTFEEFYAGRALAFRGSAYQRVAALRSRLHDPRYAEPILLALGLIGTDYADQIDEVVSEAIYPGIEPSPYEAILGRDFLFMLRVLADDTPLHTTTIDLVIEEAVSEWLAPSTARCRFSSYREAVAKRFAAFNNTKAAERLRMIVDKRTEALTPEAIRPWTQLAGIVAGLGTLPNSTKQTLTRLAIADADPRVRVEAGTALAAAGTLEKAVVASMERLATSAPTSPVRVRAASILASAGHVSEAVTGVMMLLATRAIDPSVQAAAVSVLTSRGLMEPVTTVMVGLTSDTAAPSSVRVRAMSVLASNGHLSEPAKSVLENVAVTDPTSIVRVEAAAALAACGTLREPVLAALVDLAGTAPASAVRARAVAVLASDRLLATPVKAALERLATSDPDSAVKVQAASIIASGGAISEPVATALVDIATTEPVSSVRLEAASILASSGMLIPEITATLAALAIHDPAPSARVRAASILLTHGALSEPRFLLDMLTSLPIDANMETLREAGQVSVEFSLRHPEFAADIRSWLIGTCNNACSDAKGGTTGTSDEPWPTDYAYYALKLHVEKLPS